MRQGNGKITVMRSGTSKSSSEGYESGWIYIPSKVFNDASFPFSQNEKVIVEIKDDKIIVSKREEILNILEDFGINRATLPQVLEKKANEIGERKFLYFKDRSYTFKQINENSNKIANGLKNFIKTKGKNKTKVALMVPNCPELLFSWFGIIKAGAIYIPLNPVLDIDSLKYILNDSIADILIIDYQYINSFLKIQEELPHIKKIFVQNAPNDFKFDEKYINYEEINTSNINNVKTSVRPHHDMEIIYTTGTTGKPKGIIFQNYLILTGLIIANECKKIEFLESDRTYCPIPLFYGFTQLLVVFPSLFMGTSIIISDSFHAKSFWEEIKKYKATIFCYVGGMLSYLMKQPHKEIDRNHGIKWAFGGQAPIRIWEAFENRFGITLYEGWTLTEGIGMTFNRSGSRGGKIGSCGKPIASFRIKIVDSYGTQLPPGKDNVGEILSKNILPISFSKYYKQGERYELKIDKDGYFFTGDIGYLDNDGYLYYCGKLQDLIKKSGKNILAKDIEKIAKSHPSIKEAAVFGVKNMEFPESEIKIVAVLYKKNAISHSEFFEYLAKNMAYMMVPRFIEFKSRLPRTPTYLIQKYKLKEEWERGESQKNTWDCKIKNFIKKI